MKTPEKLIWLFGESIDVKEAIVVVAAVIIILGFVTG